MSDMPHKIVSDENWSQLMTLASGYLALEEGDIQASMARALKAHADLIRAIKKGEISADLPGGRVTMFVPPEGGVALRTERPETAEDEPPAGALDSMIDAPTEIEEQPLDLPGMAPDVPAGIADPKGQGQAE